MGLEAGTELAVVTAQNAVEIFTKGGLKGILDGVEQKVRAMSLDASTVAGREEIRSVAYKVTRTKTALDAEAKKLTEGWRAATAQVNTERKVAQERLEALAEEVRAPLTAFENKEKTRVAAHEAALIDIQLPANLLVDADALETIKTDILAAHLGRDWEEFSDRAEATRKATVAILTERIDARRKYDADQAELARLREAEIERQRIEREEKLKAEAAEKARLEAERRAKEAADAEARRVIEAARREQERVAAEAERVRVENERQQREAEAARQREQEAREAAEKRAKQAETDKIEASRKAEADKKAAEQKAAADLKSAQEKAKKDADAAVAKEKARVEAQRKADAEAQAKREADNKHREKIREEITTDLAAYGKRTEMVEALMAGKIRHTRVAF